MEFNTHGFHRKKILIPDNFLDPLNYDPDYHGAFTISGCLDIEVTNLYLIKIN